METESRCDTCSTFADRRPVDINVYYTSVPRKDAECGTVAIIDSQLPYSDRPTPPNCSLYALKETLQDLVLGRGFATVRNE